MGNNNMTAVEWLIRQIEKEGSSWINIGKGRLQISIDANDYSEFKKQAKEMQKEQLVESFYQGMKSYPFDPSKGRAELYFDETYG